MVDTTPLPWGFDARSPFRDSYEEHLLQEATSLAIADCVMRALAEVREDPFTEDFVTVGDQTWFIKSVGGFAFDGEDIPHYLLVYALHSGRRIIYPLLVCKASAIGKMVDDATRSRELVRLVERTLAKADRRRAH